MSVIRRKGCGVSTRQPFRGRTINQNEAADSFLQYGQVGSALDST